MELLDVVRSLRTKVVNLVMISMLIFEKPSNLIQRVPIDRLVALRREAHSNDLVRHLAQVQVVSVRLVPPLLLTD